MDYGRYVGRVGALAVALGVGFAVATTPGWAWAEDGASTAGGGDDDTSSVDTKLAETQPAAGSEGQHDDGGSDPGDPGSGSNATTTTTTTGSNSTTVIGGGGSPQVTISGSTVESSRSSTEQTAASSAPTAVSEATPTVAVEATGASETPGYTPPEPTSTPSVDPEPLVSTAPDPDLPPSTPPGSSRKFFPGEGDLQPSTGDADGLTGTTMFTTLDGADADAGQLGLRMSGPSEVADTQNSMAANVAEGVTALDEPAPPPVAVPDPVEAILAFTGSIISRAVNAVATALAPIFGPGAPFYNSTLWGFVEAVRRQTNQVFSNSTPVVDLQTTGQQDADDREIHGTLGASDPDGDALTYSVPATGPGAPSNGTVSIDAEAGTWTYTPNTGYSGDDSFTITASDATAGYHVHGPGQAHTRSDSITVTVTDANTPVNMAPVIESVNAGTVNHADGSITYAVTASDDRTAPKDLLVTVTQPADGSGTVSDAVFEQVTGTWHFTYTPAARERVDAYSTTDVVEQDHFTVTVSDTEKSAQQAISANVDPTPAAVIESSDIPGGAQYGVGVADGFLYQTTADYDFTTGNYTTHVSVIDPADPDNPKTATLVGFAPVGEAVEADGFVYQTVNGTDGGYVMVIDTAHPQDYTKVDLPGEATFGIVAVGDRAYQTSQARLTDPTTGETAYTTYVSIIDPTAPDDPVVINMPGYSTDSVVVADGFLYQTSETTYDESAANGDYTTYVTVINPADTEHPARAELAGRPEGGVVMVDGRAYQTTYDYDPTTSATRVSVIDPDDPENPWTSTNLPGTPYGPVVLGDGVVYQTTGYFDDTGTFITQVSVIDPDAPEPAQTSAALPGIPRGQVAVAEGRAYLTTYEYHNDTSTFTTYVSMIDPDDLGQARPIAEVSSEPSGGVVVDDGFAYQTTSTQDAAGVTTHVTVINLAHPDQQQTVDVSGGPTALVAVDGLVYQTTQVQNAATGEYTTHVTVIDPADPDHPTTIELPGRPAGHVVVDSGTVYQTTFTFDYSTGKGTAHVSAIKVAPPVAVML
ncbi:hypothetical protein AU193_09690 [Mycobacterium sp. GA-1285]|uniref:Ig-like domain-containing protein n=1 Tax=Mycobacterium sp. GA-1285 TaxID=1772282 RepID=UPI00074B283F|nr:Ig-like domain-containing protein [Mycobacterium sp. GA-1285]KUI22890.1 hypothetical protein AU193_09690 [Mycobacterium sp. GA-1285]